MAEVFISFKNTANGQPTVDSAYAKNLYDALNGLGIDCFFSNETLAEMGTDDFMARIEDEIERAQTMIVVCSNPDFIKDGWVRQEWSTFLNLMLGSQDKPRSLFSYTIGCNPHSLPAFLQNYQSFTSISEAVVFIENVLHSADAADDVYTPAEFWNRFYGIFCNSDIDQALESAAAEDAPVEAALFQARADIAAGLNKAAATQLLREECSRGNAIAGFMMRETLLKGFLGYRSVKEAKACSRECLASYSPALSTGDENVLLLVWNEKPQDLTRAMCYGEIIHAILRDYGIASSLELRYFSDHEPFELDFDGFDRIIALISSRSCCLDDPFVEGLAQVPPEKTDLMLNGFLSHALPKELRHIRAVDCSPAGVAQVCRSIIVEHQADSAQPSITPISEA